MDDNCLPNDFIIPKRKTSNKTPPQQIVCKDCNSDGAFIPFDIGDGFIRCAGCAVDRFMNVPFKDEVLGGN